MLYSISKLLSFLSKPIIWLFLMIISSYIFKKQRCKLLMISCFSFFILTNGFIVDELLRLWQLPPASLEKNYDIGIVLGGICDYNKDTERLNFNKHADRLFDAELLYHTGRIKKIMISGGNPIDSNKKMEANVLREYLIKKKIPHQDIIIENKSRNTKENVLYSSNIIKKEYNEKTLLLITSADHIRRARMCFEENEIIISIYPTDCITSYRNYDIRYILMPRIEAIEKWEGLIHELIGYIIYKISFYF